MIIIGHNLVVPARIVGVIIIQYDNLAQVGRHLPLVLPSREILGVHLVGGGAATMLASGQLDVLVWLTSTVLVASGGLRLANELGDVGGRYQAHILLGDEVGEVSLHQRGTLGVTPLRLRLLDDELFLADSLLEMWCRLQVEVLAIGRSPLRAPGRIQAIRRVIFLAFSILRHREWSTTAVLTVGLTFRTHVKVSLVLLRLLCVRLQGQRQIAAGSFIG